MGRSSRWTAVPRLSRALAIKDGKILAVGSDAEIRRDANNQTRIIDLAGRTVIPGLMDSHIHALRAALTHSVELSWAGIPTLTKAIGVIHDAARRRRPGTWIKIGGGWTELQFQEKRGPTIAELVAAAPGRPIYVQRLYNTAWITPAGLKLMKLDAGFRNSGRKRPKRTQTAISQDVTGVNRTFNFFTGKIPQPDFDQQLAGTKLYFRDMNRLGLTAINDFPGGGMLPEHYRAVQTLWQKHQMTLRVSFHIGTEGLPNELDSVKAMTAFTPMNFGDDMLRFRGIGEALTQGMYDGSTVAVPFNPTDKDRENFCAVVKWAAEHGMNVQQHAASDKAASMILDCF